MSIECSGDTIVRQAADSTEFYMIRALRVIDDVFGDGYCKNHPELAGQFIRACSIDYAATVLAKEIGASLASVADAYG